MQTIVLRRNLDHLRLISDHMISIVLQPHVYDPYMGHNHVGRQGSHGRS